MRAFYFGCFQGAGHYLHDEAMRHKLWLYGERRYDAPIPWDLIDGRLNPPSWAEGEALLHHRDGWTALAFADRSIDERPNSNSIFFFEAVLDFDSALTAAREHFAVIVKYLPFEIVPAPSEAPRLEGGAP